MKTGSFALLILLGLFVIAAAAALGMWAFKSELPSYLANLYTTILGILWGIMISDVVALYFAQRERRSEKLAEKREQRWMLIKKMGSSDNRVAIEAIEECRAHDYLFDGTLSGAHDFRKADWRGANLQHVHMEGVRFGVLTRLEGADLTCAHIVGATGFEDAFFSEETRLPSGIKWHPSIDVSYYTSEAYGKSEYDCIAHHVSRGGKYYSY